MAIISPATQIPLPALPYGARNLFPTGLAPWNHASSVSSSIDFLLLIRCTMYRMSLMALIAGDLTGVDRDRFAVPSLPSLLNYTLKTLNEGLDRINLASYLADFLLKFSSGDRPLFDNLCQGLTHAQRNVIQTVLSR
ncbi:hypothetical protein HID58_075466 [Brassica napus]|uniref:Uncharacterized protein n=1 Tax=Brassica napus TaxID=3708 RepID=A0ABQ7YJP8_BRANA|nr:hypothetical protein HID58_075466 [Brassica napus]